MVVKKIFLAGLLLCIAQHAALFAPALQAKAIEPAVNFSLTDLEGKLVTLTDYKEKPLLLFFWTTWCPFCREELKALNARYPELSKEGLEVLAVNAGERGDKVAGFVKAYNLSYRVLLDEDLKVTEEYEVLGVPTYILVGRSGNINFKGYRFPEQKYKDLLSGRDE